MRNFRRRAAASVAGLVALALVVAGCTVADDPPTDESADAMDALVEAAAFDPRDDAPTTVLIGNDVSFDPTSLFVSGFEVPFSGSKMEDLPLKEDSVNFLMAWDEMGNNLMGLSIASSRIAELQEVTLDYASTATAVVATTPGLIPTTPAEAVVVRTLIEGSPDHPALVEAIRSGDEVAVDAAMDAVIADVRDAIATLNEELDRRSEPVDPAEHQNPHTESRRVMSTPADSYGPLKDTECPPDFTKVVGTGLCVTDGGVNEDGSVALDFQNRSRLWNVIAVASNLETGAAGKFLRPIPPKKFNLPGVGDTVSGVVNLVGGGALDLCGWVAEQVDRVCGDEDRSYLGEAWGDVIDLARVDAPGTASLNNIRPEDQFLPMVSFTSHVGSFHSDYGDHIEVHTHSGEVLRGKDGSQQAGTIHIAGVNRTQMSAAAAILNGYTMIAEPLIAGVTASIGTARSHFRNKGEGDAPGCHYSEVSVGDMASALWSILRSPVGEMLMNWNDNDELTPEILFGKLVESMEENPVGFIEAILKMTTGCTMSSTLRGGLESALTPDRLLKGIGAAADTLLNTFPSMLNSDLAHEQMQNGSLAPWNMMPPAMYYATKDDSAALVAANEQVISNFRWELAEIIALDLTDPTTPADYAGEVFANLFGGKGAEERSYEEVELVDGVAAHGGAEYQKVSDPIIYSTTRGSVGAYLPVMRYLVYDPETAMEVARSGQPVLHLCIYAYSSEQLTVSMDGFVCRDASHKWSEVTDHAIIPHTYYWDLDAFGNLREWAVEDTGWERRLWYEGEEFRPLRPEGVATDAVAEDHSFSGEYTLIGKSGEVLEHSYGWPASTYKEDEPVPLTTNPDALFSVTGDLRWEGENPHLDFLEGTQVRPRNPYELVFNKCNVAWSEGRPNIAPESGPTWSRNICADIIGFSYD